MPNMGFLAKMAQKMVNKHLKNAEITCDKVTGVEPIEDPDYGYVINTENCKATLFNYNLDLGNLKTKSNVDKSALKKIL